MAHGVPSWSVYSASQDGAGGWAAEENSPVLIGYVELLGGVVRGLVEEVRTVESRQVALDRRLAEFGGLLQGLQEEQASQAPGHQAVTASAQQALHTAVAVQRRIEQDGELNSCLQGLSDGWAKRLEQLCQQHGRWLLELSADVAALRGEKGGGGGGGGGCTDLALTGDQVALLDARIASLEQGQKTVAVGARRALHTALVVHQQQQSQDHDNQWEKCLDSLPVAELEQQCTRRFAEQDERLDKVLLMVDVLTDRVLMQQAVAEGGRGEDLGVVSRLREKVEDLEAKLSQKVDSLEAGVFGLASEVESCRLAGMDEALASPSPRGPGTLNQIRDFMAAALESVESRLRRSLNEVDQRLEALQDGRDQQRLALRQLGQQLPEVSQKLDQLWAQCQHYFPRVKEHDVHFGFFRSSFEAHKQSMLDHADGLEQREHRAAAAAAARGSPESRAGTPASIAFAPLQGYAPSQPSRPPASAELGPGFSSFAADALQLGSSRAAPPQEPPAAAPRRPARTAGEEDDEELGARAKMLEQIMARLHGRDGSERVVDVHMG